MAAGVLPTYRACIAKFWAHYMGVEGRVVPFGGRNHALNKLDTWLADNSSPKRLLVTAPAGRGKTALLSRWSEAAQKRIDTVFIPISVRFETSGPEAFYTLLAARLAYINGSSLPSIACDIAGSYAEFCAHELDAMEKCNRQLLIVIDGLDEAGGWEINVDLLSPTRRNIHVLVSARPMFGEPAQREGERWLERLEWHLGKDSQIVDLPLLDTAGITEVAASAGITINEDSNLARELGRLSEGDPLLLRYLIEDLNSVSANDAEKLIEEMRRRAAGFGEYFRLWVIKQRPIWSSEGREAPTFEAVLALLACAIGPLTMNDLESLLSRMDRPPCAVARPLHDMARFVLKVEGGFILAHPRLGDHLRTTHFREGRLVSLARGAILSWGIDTLDALTSDHQQSVPQYLVRFLVRHMVEANSGPGTLMRVSELGWLSACERVDGHLLGYATQLRIAGDYAQRQSGPNDPAHGWTIAVGLLLNSIRNSASVPPKLLTACVEKGVISSTRALVLLAYSNLEERVRGTIALLPHIAEGERLPRIHDALALAAMVPDTEARIRARSAAVNALPASPERSQLEEELLDDALSDLGSMYYWMVAIEAISPTMTGSRALRLVEEGLAQVRGDDDWHYLHSVLDHLDEEALSYAWERIIQHQYPGLSEQTTLGLSLNALASLFRFLPSEAKKEVWPEALAAAREEKAGFHRALALAGVQPSLPTSLRADVDGELLAAAEQSDGTLNGYILSLTDVACIAEGDVAIRALNLAGERAVLELSREPYSRIENLARLLTDDLLNRAYDAAVGSRYGSVRAAALESLAPRLSTAQLTTALQALSRFDDSAAIHATRAVLASHVGRSNAIAPITDYFNAPLVNSDPSWVLFLVKFLAGSAFPLVPNLQQSVAESGWEEWLERAVDPLTGAPSAWRYKLMHALLSGPCSAQVLAAVAPHIPENLCTLALDVIGRTSLDDRVQTSFSLVALSAVAARLGLATDRGLAVFETRKHQVLDHHWPAVALGIAPLIDTARASRMREHALRIGISLAESWPETIVPLLDLGAPQDIIANAFLARSASPAHNRNLEGLLLRLQGDPLKRVLTNLLGTEKAEYAVAADPVARSRLFASTWLKLKISKAEHRSRLDLVNTIAEVCAFLVTLEGAAGAAAALAALETASRRFP